MRKQKHPYLKQVKHERVTFHPRIRNLIFRRDKFKCQLCDKDLKELPKERVLDHKIPLSKFGTNDLSNIWLLCNTCDKQKGSELIPVAVESHITNRIQELKDKYKL